MFSIFKNNNNMEYIIKEDNLFISLKEGDIDLKKLQKKYGK